MLVSTPRPFLNEVLDMLKHWHAGRKSFSLPEIEPLIGKLNHVAQTNRWMLHLMGHLYTSLAAAIGSNRRYLIHSSKAFRDMLKLIKAEPTTEAEHMESTFATAETARQVHRTTKKYTLLPSAKEELRIISTALLDESVLKSTPIAHLIKRCHDSISFGDSSLDAMGGYSIPMGYWWHYAWPKEIRDRTIRSVKNDKDGKMIVINCMEYATILINYAAAYHYWVKQNNIEKTGIQYPTTQIMADNKTAESWTTKGCKRSMTGRALGRLQCALMINSPVGIYTDYINTKDNIIADEISRFQKLQLMLSKMPELYQRFPSLGACRRFIPSADLISYIKDCLLQKQLTDPLIVRKLVQENPGRIVGYSIAEEHEFKTRGS
jgi:hypothetical protein